ncbi:MAG: hypothetical protein QXS20_00125 [Candidatus Thorarchaeota archaeon]
MNQGDPRDEAYWLGVRDALRMIDSFVRWSNRNPDKAKSISEFIDDALLAVAKRCESCLSHTLGLSFSKVSGPPEVTEIPESPRVETESRPPMRDYPARDSPLSRTLADADDLYSQESRHAEESQSPPSTTVPGHGAVEPELPPLTEEWAGQETEPESGTPVSDDTHYDIVQSPSVDQLLHTDGVSREEPVSEPLKRFEFDIGPDFDAGPEAKEPVSDQQSEPMIVESVSRPEAGPPEGHSPGPESPLEMSLPEALDELEREFESHGLTISPEPDRVDMSAAEPSIVAPTEESDHAIRDQFSTCDETEIPVNCPEEGSVEIPVETGPDDSPPAPAERFPRGSSLWSPYDEPSLVGDTGAEDSTRRSTVAPGGVRSPPPPPPPPPETDESLEERTRRNRRLFFGV